MANAKQRRAQRTTAPDAGKAFVVDSFQNLAARVGLGSGNQADGGKYNFTFTSRNRQLLEAAYRTSWVCGRAVDCIAEDMTRAGVTIQSDTDPDDVETLERAMIDLRIWDELCDTIKWARLYGGAIAVMLIDGQEPSTPLMIDRITKDQFKGLVVLDRWMVQPTLNDLVTEYGPDLGMPKFYDVTTDGKALMGKRVHYSRVIRIDGVTLPHWQRIAENLWGQSELERLWDRLLAFDSTTLGAGQLVYKAHLRTISIQNLRELIAMGGKPFDALVQQIDMIRRYQSNEGMTLLDANDKFEAHSYAFSGLDAVMLQFAQQISGATEIPLVRLFGQSPAGLNSTGESDIRNYYDKVNAQQDRKLRQGLAKVLQVLHASVLGKPAGDGFGFEFRPLWQLSDTEKATIANSVTAAVTAAESSGLVDRSTALRELRHSAQVTGIWGHITDEQIEEAENEPPPVPELGDPDADPDDGQDPTQEGQQDPAAKAEKGGAAVRDGAPSGRLSRWLDRFRVRPR